MDDQPILSNRFDKFVAIPQNFILEKDRISDIAFRLMIVLCFFSNNNTDVSWPGYKSLREYTGFCNQTIIKAVRELEASGWLHRRKRFSKSTIYILDNPEANSRTSSLRNRISTKQRLTRLKKKRNLHSSESII